MKWKEFKEIADEMYDMCLDDPKALYFAHYENTEESFKSIVDYFIVKLRLLYFHNSTPTARDEQ